MSCKPPDIIIEYYLIKAGGMLRQLFDYFVLVLPTSSLRLPAPIFTWIVIVLPSPAQQVGISALLPVSICADGHQAAIRDYLSVGPSGIITVTELTPDSIFTFMLLRNSPEKSNV